MRNESTDENERPPEDPEEKETEPGGLRKRMKILAVVGLLVIAALLVWAFFHIGRS